MVEDKVQVYEVTHSSPEFKTVADYIRDPSSPAHRYVDDTTSFLSVLHRDGKTTNRQSIESKYTKKEDKKYIGKDATQLKLIIGTKLAIPTNKIDRVGLLTQGIEVVSNDIPAFKARALAELEADQRYRPKNKPIDGKLQGKLSEEYPDMTVWIWCRALSEAVEDNEGQIFNITPFVQKVNTNVDKNGGNFQLNLPPLVCEVGESGKWIIKRQSLKQYETSKNTSLQGDGFVAEANLFKIGKDGGLKRNEFLFHNIISSNDMVWIRFETLEIEKEQRIKDNAEFYINKANLAGRIYDMIGLVDSNALTIDPQDNNVSISINGRDLSKLFIEDGSYFYPLEMSQGKLNFAGGTTQQNSLMQRVFSDNALQYFNSYFNNSIENVLKFVIQQLSTIKVVPDDLFTSYGERRNKKFNEGAQSKQVRAQKNNLLEIEKKAKREIGEIRNSAQLTNSNSLEESKEIDILWLKLLHFMSELRSQKVRESDGNVTMGWKSFSFVTSSGTENIVAHTLPEYFFKNLHITLYYTKAQVFQQKEKALFNNIDKYLDLKESQPQNEEIWTSDLANGIWQIVKLVIDDGVTQRRIVDSSASSANGSLLNYIRKVCQEPFVEFYMDTYGDTYNLIVRKPPYDKAGVLSMLNGRYNVGKEGGKDSSVISTVIEIEAEDILKEELSYDDKGVVTWYQLMPQANFLGNSSTYALAYLPAIFFEEYADIWGSKPMQCVHNYIPYLSLNPTETTLDICEKQAFEDLKYMVESNAYVPFTRRGTLTLNGDRRLKYGNIVRYKSTGEIFFIEHVQQMFSINENSIDRTTVVQVSRGMKEVLINGVAISSKERYMKDLKTDFSYFDIINTDLGIASEKEYSEVITERIQVGVEKATQTSSEIDNLFANVKRYKGYKWALGTSGEGGRIDCSGFVSKVLQLSGVKIARSTAEEIMKKSQDFKPVEVFDATLLKEGDVLGFDTGRTSFDSGRKYSIDHIAIVVRNMNSGQLELAESVSKAGVRSRPLAEALIRYNRTSIKKYTGNFRFAEKEVVETPIYETKTSTVQRRDIDRSKVFSNFRVFKSCFNFFLRRRMNDDRLVSNKLKEVVINGQNINHFSEEEIKEYKKVFDAK